MYQRHKSIRSISQFQNYSLIAAEAKTRASHLLVESSPQEGVSVASQNAMGLRPAALGNITLSNVKVSCRVQIRDQSSIMPASISYARLGWCALAVGTARAILDEVIPYANERIALRAYLPQTISSTKTRISVLRFDTMKILTQRSCTCRTRQTTF